MRRKQQRIRTSGLSRRYSVEKLVEMFKGSDELSEALGEVITYRFIYYSDGCTGVPEVVLEDETGKDIICVTHDWHYYTEKYSKHKADLLLLSGYVMTKHPLRGLIRYSYFAFGGGKKAWKKHREANHSFKMWKEFFLNEYLGV